MALRLVLSLIFLFFVSQGFSQTETNDSTQTGTYYFKSNDKITIHGYFKNTKRHKIWTWYTANGNINKKIKYKYGKQLWIIYYEKNKPWLKINRYGKRRIIRACDCRENG